MFLKIPHKCSLYIIVIFLATTSLYQNATSLQNILPFIVHAKAVTFNDRQLGINRQ